MSIEMEIKFIGVDFNRLRNRLKEQKALMMGKYFEENIVFDNEEDLLKSRKMLLRLRRADKISVCLKKPVSDVKVQGLKVLEEYEIQVDDFEATRNIFLNLGFYESFRYEKLRERWKIDDCYVFLDQLPFGNFVELEGTESSIEFASRKLGLDEYPSTDKNYYQLYIEHPDEGKSLVFSESFKSRVLAGR